MSVLQSKPTGYPIQIFGDEKFKKFQCIICKNILKNPVQVNCGHRSCQACFQYILSSRKGGNISCPTCHEEGDEAEFSLDLQQMFTDFSIKKEMAGLPVKCFRCEWSGKFKDFEGHYNDFCSEHNTLTSLCHENTCVHPMSHSAQSTEEDERSHGRPNSSGIHLPSSSISTNSMNPIEERGSLQSIQSNSDRPRKEVPTQYDESTLNELKMLNIRPKIKFDPETKRKEYDALASGPLDLRSDDSLAVGPRECRNSDLQLLPSVQETDAMTDQQVINSGRDVVHVPPAAVPIPQPVQNPVGAQGPANIGPPGGQIPASSEAISTSNNETIRITRNGPNGPTEVTITGTSKFLHGVQVGNNNVMYVNSKSSSTTKSSTQPVVKRAPAPAAAATATAAKPKIQIVVPNRQVDRDILQTVANKIPKSWKPVGRRLALTDDTLDRVEVDHHIKGVEETAYQMLNTWKQQAGPSATYQALAKALVESKRADVAKLLSSSAK